MNVRSRYLDDLKIENAKHLLVVQFTASFKKWYNVKQNQKNICDAGQKPN